MPLKKRIERTFSRRANFLIVITYSIGAIICWRLFFLSVVKHDFYLGKAEVQQSFAQAENFRRGEIYLIDREGKKYPLAINKSWPLAYAEPNKISVRDKLNLSKRLAEILQMDQKTILRKISYQNDPFEVLKHKLSPEEADAVNNLHIKGIGCKLERNLRYYPAQTLAAHVVGFLGYRHGERKGQYGVEEYYDKELTPGNNLDKGSDKGQQKGKDLILTIDPNVQLFVEEQLDETVKKYKAESGTVIVMNPRNGKIIAMANYPNFNPNQYAQVKNLNLFVNQAISESFEPGSVFKPIIMAIALQQGVVTPVSTYIDKGFVKIGGHIIENAEKKAFGKQTMTQVLEKSLNTGIVYVERLLKKDVIKNYLRKFGFGRKTGIDLPGEAVGSLRNLESNRDINFATAAFGQGISVTSIQLLRAISAIANKGILVKPYVVERVGDHDIIQDRLSQKQLTQQIISPETANRLIAMLVDVTEKGTGRRARIPNYWIATKTGTAQIPFKDKRGYSNDTIQTIVGFAPAYNAQFAVLAKLDRPQGVRFAAVSVAPLFKNISAYLLNYFEIPPERQ